jgi:RimJ/RimL family protein N-acetyltransferase
MPNLWADAPTLAGDHVTLRPVTRADRDGLLAAFADGLGDIFTSVVPKPETIDSWFAIVEREQAAGRAMVFCVLDADGRVSGTTRFMRMSSVHRRVEIGGTLYAERVQRTGVNSEAKLMLLRHAFDVLGCNVVQIRTDWLNLRSRTAIERLGAKLDGVLRGHLIMPDGHVRDTTVYSILAGEWPGVRANLEHRLRRYDRR